MAKESTVLSVVTFACEGSCHQLPPGKTPCSPALQLESKRADGLAGPDSSQIAWEVWVECRGAPGYVGEGTRSHRLPSRGVFVLGQAHGVFCPLGNRDVLQGLFLVLLAFVKVP